MKEDDRFKSLEIKKKQSQKDIADGGLELNCPACGGLYKLNSNFCANCGGDLRKINRKSVPAHKGLGTQIDVQQPESSASSASAVPKMSKNEYEKRSGKIKQELKYRYAYILIVVVFLLLLFFKSSWFLF